MPKRCMRGMVTGRGAVLGSSARRFLCVSSHCNTGSCHMFQRSLERIQLRCLQYWRLPECPMDVVRRCRLLPLGQQERQLRNRSCRSSLIIQGPFGLSFVLPLGLLQKWRLRARMNVSGLLIGRNFYSLWALSRQSQQLLTCFMALFNVNPVDD